MSNIHLRTQLINKLVEILQDKTLAEARVFSNRLRNMLESEMPAILIYTNNEDANRDGTGRPAKQRRELNINLDIYANTIEDDAEADLDNTLNTIASQVEQILAVNHTLEGLSNDIKYTGMEINLNSEGEKPFGILRMNYTISYRVYENNPNNPIY